MPSLDNITLGIYEKALPETMTWQERLSAAAEAGFDFLELSVDESEFRQERLDWGTRQRVEIRAAIQATGIPILTMCLSAQRRFPMGSALPEIRRESLNIVRKAIDFAGDLGIRIILVPGYEDYDGPIDDQARARFLEGLHQVVTWASRAGVMLALENTERSLTSITQTLDYVSQVRSPWLQLYGDMGNLNALGYDVVDEIAAGAGHLVGLHAKDTLPGQFRNIALGSGTVPFIPAFRALWQIGFSGPIMLEMWVDDNEQAIQAITAARQWLQARLLESLD